MKRTSRRQSVDRQIPNLLKKPITYELHDLLSLASGDDDLAADAGRRILNQFAARIAALFDYYGIDRTSDEPELRLFSAMGSDLFPNAFRIDIRSDDRQAALSDESLTCWRPRSASCSSVLALR